MDRSLKEVAEEIHEIMTTGKLPDSDDDDDDDYLDDDDDDESYLDDEEWDQEINY